jgi:hypothetical protein
VVLLADHVEALASAYARGSEPRRAHALVCALPAAAAAAPSSFSPTGGSGGKSSFRGSGGGGSATPPPTAAAAAAAAGVPSAVAVACRGVAADATLWSVALGAASWQLGLSALRDELPARGLAPNAACVNTARE